MCCASREPADAFKQYIDTSSGTGEYNPKTLEEHWNSPHMMSVRKRMMTGEILPECEVCNDKLLNTDVYRTYFWHLFQHHYDTLWEKTLPNGYTEMKPVSWDYRFSNLCNFKCRMCGDMLSSAWETEEKMNNMIDWTDASNNWMKPEVRQQISKFQDEQIEREFAQAVEEHRVEEIYWVGGEPLMYEQHWRYMQRIIELGDGHRLYARYNTNLSRIKYKEVDLYKDILCNIRDWQICASLDGTGQIGEYIRTGLNYQAWVTHFEKGVEIMRNRRQMRIDFTLTLPGLLDVHSIQELADRLGVDILAKVTFTFSPNVILSPLALPREILNRQVDQLITGNTLGGALKDVLIQLKNRPNIEEQWGEEQYWKGMQQGKRRLLTLERIRQDSTCMRDILSADTEMQQWWDSIDVR
jgi:hypothetical protein